jgi:glycine/D-amino acid oxidase-like deaminating enzyme
VLGGYWIPSDGAAKGVKIAEALARRAQAAGIRFEGGVTVTGFDTTDGGVHAVDADRGRIECERVLLCAGLWGPTVGAMAGVPIPLVAVQHQLVWTEPVPELANLAGDTWAQQPIVRHQDMSLYFRQRDDHYGVGNYRHEPIVTPQANIRAPGGAMQPSLMPFTPEDFDLCETETSRLFPSLAGRMRPSDPARSLNGMFSFTPDAGSVVGESANVRGFWVCEAVWVTHAAGMARQAVEWMVAGEPTYDMAEADANRFYPFQSDGALRRRARQAAVPRGLRHPASAPAAVGAAEPATDAVL